MEAQGYTYCGAAPHYLDKFSDQWFWKKNSEKVYAETKNWAFTVHLMTDKHKKDIEAFNAFRDYLNENESAREEYKAAKLKGLTSDGKVSIWKYVETKVPTVLKLREEALLWKKK